MYLLNMVVIIEKSRLQVQALLVAKEQITDLAIVDSVRFRTAK